MLGPRLLLVTVAPHHLRYGRNLLQQVDDDHAMAVGVKVETEGSDREQCDESDVSCLRVAKCGLGLRVMRFLLSTPNGHRLCAWVSQVCLRSRDEEWAYVRARARWENAC